MLDRTATMLIKYGFRQVLNFTAEKIDEAKETEGEWDDIVWVNAHNAVRALALFCGFIDEGGQDDPGTRGGDGGGP